MTHLAGVLLDVDGTLVDSNDAHAQAWVLALAEHGRQIDFAEVRRCIGMGGDKLLPKVAGIASESELGKKISDARGHIFQTRFLPDLKPCRGANDLLRRLHADGFRLAVASSAKKGELQGLLRVCGADEFIHTKTSSDDAENSKPDPDIIHAALQQVGLAANQMVLLGDTPYDLQSAQKAGVGMVAVRCGGWSDGALVGALAIFADPADLLAHYSASPFARQK